MAKQSFKLSKNIISNKKVKDSLSLGFENLAKSETPVNLNRIKEIYDEIFYDIPIDGKESHKNLVEQEYNYLYSNHNLNLDKKIKKLSTRINEKTTILDNLELVPLNTPEHPLYEDGSILQQGSNGVRFQDAVHVWVMQEGRKRRFESDSNDIFIQVKKALNLPKNEPDGRYFISTEEINSIPNGKPIVTTSDLNLKGNQIIPTEDLPIASQRYAYLTVEIECLGSEVADFSTQVINGEQDLSDLQFYLGSDGCVVKYFKDDFSTDETPITVETININKGETVTLDILREGLGIEDTGIPSDKNEYYTAAGGYDIANQDYYGNEISDYIKNWGPFGEYEGILYATGRLKIKQLPNDYLQNELFMPQDTSQEILNGLPDNTTIGATESTITILQVSSNYVGQEISAYNTKMIYKGSFSVGQQLWGSLNQPSDLQNSVFDDPNNKYYKKTMNVDKGIGNTPIYGQPILRYMNTYCVLLGGYSELSTRKLRFLDLVSGGKFTRRRGQVEDDLDWQMITSSGLGILGMKWDSEKLRQRIVGQGYVGLQEYRTNMYEGQGNYFNPDTTGNNYKYPFPAV
mgnify:CR=1 FL=1|tara:strand:- start:10245 stop:11966 length:1722 start_codon:yes stop_codon:yes gene_type:complete